MQKSAWRAISSFRVRCENANGFDRCHVRQHQVEIDPNSAIYKAEKVDVKTGEEDEETLFTLGKAKLFEYQKSEGDGAVSHSLPRLLASMVFRPSLFTNFRSPAMLPQSLLRTAAGLHCLTCSSLPRLHYRLLTLCPAPTDPVGQSWPRGQLWPIVSVYVCMYI